MTPFEQHVYQLVQLIQERKGGMIGDADYHTLMRTSPSKEEFEDFHFFESLIHNVTIEQIRQYSDEMIPSMAEWETNNGFFIPGITFLLHDHGGNYVVMHPKYEGFCFWEHEEGKVTKFNRWDSLQEEDSIK